MSSVAAILIFDVFFTVYFFGRALMTASEQNFLGTLLYASLSALYVAWTRLQWRRWREQRNRESP